MHFRTNKFLAALLLLAAPLLAGCGPKTDCTTAKEFVESYSQAYRDENVGAVMKMQAGTGLLEKMRLDPVLKEELKDYSLEKEKEDLKKSFKEGGMWTQAWKNTEYRGQRDCGDHIHVDVSVNGTPSAVVLVRDGDFLRIHPRPSWFNCPPEAENPQQ